MASLDQLAKIAGDHAFRNLPAGRGLYDAEVVHIAVDGYTQLVAARVNTGTTQPIGVWALGGPYVDAVDSTAQKYTIWGEAAEPGSVAAKDRATMLRSTAYRDVKACVPRD